MVKPNGYIQGADGNPLELVDATARRQLAGKLNNPGNLKSGDYLRVQSIGADGTVVLEGAQGGGNGSGQNPPQDGEDGATFTPTVSADGTLSWTNDKGLENPAPVNIKGPQGEKGQKGDTGAPGADGAQGPKGDRGEPGAQGNQGPKGDTGATGPQGEPSKDGADGAPGKDGVSATHSWNGTTLTITSASGTSSADLKGDKGEKGDTGATGPKGDTGATGAAGKNGTDGYSPVRGTDYWTEADKVEIVQRVIESLGGNPIFGIVDENNNIIVSGDLPDGTYSVKYEMENGTKLNIGNLVIDTNVYYTVTNTLTNCTNSNSATQVIEGENYSATITAKSGYELKSVTVTMGGSPVTVSGGTISIANVTGNIVITAVAEEIKASYTNLATKFQIGKRYNSSGAIVDQADACAVEDYIPFTIGTVVRIKGFGVMDKYTCPLYMSDKTTVNTAGKVNALSSHMDYSYDSTSKVVTITAKNANNAWIRIAGVLTGTTADVIITVNEEIV